MDLVGDERAQSIQVGAVLLFAILIVAFSSYQAFVVPNQNRQVEFNHYTDSQADMEEIRNAVINSGQSGSVVSQSFSLGTNYPSRLVASQPERTYGSLRASPISSEPNITIQDASENASTICGPGATATRSITYRPEYFYLNSAGDITYENTVVYTTGRQGGKAFQTEQQLIDGTTIQLYPLLGNYSESGGGVTSISFSGGTTGKATSVSGPFTVTLPTSLSVSEWETLLEDEDADGIVTEVTANSTRQAVDISFSSGSYDIRCSPTGTRGSPSNEPTADDGGGNNEINPAGPNDISLESVTENGGDVTAEFNNTANRDTSATSVRIPFAFVSKNNVAGTDIDPYNVFAGGTSRTDNYEIGEALQPLDPAVSLPGNGTSTDVTVSFAADEFNQGGFVVFTLQFESGETGTYFLDIPSSSSGGGGPGRGNN